MVLVCDEIELQNIVRKLKGKSAQKFKEFQNIPKEETYNLWAQKFDRKPIVSDKQLSNTIEYIQVNREKHQLPDINKGLQPLVKKMTCSHEHAFRTEYTGGFDVVIGNPPYLVVKGGRWVGGFQYDKHAILDLKNRFETASQQINTYNLFLELGLKLTKINGLISQITPNTFLANEYSQKLREYLANNSYIIEIFNSGLVFDDAGVETAVITYKNSINLELLTNIKLSIDDIPLQLCLSEIMKLTEVVCNATKIPFERN